MSFNSLKQNIYLYLSDLFTFEIIESASNPSPEAALLLKEQQILLKKIKKILTSQTEEDILNGLDKIKKELDIFHGRSFKFESDNDINDFSYDCFVEKINFIIKNLNSFEKNNIYPIKTINNINFFNMVNYLNFRNIKKYRELAINIIQKFNLKGINLLDLHTNNDKYNFLIKLNSHLNTISNHFNINPSQIGFNKKLWIGSCDYSKNITNKIIYGQFCTSSNIISIDINNNDLNTFTHE